MKHASALCVVILLTVGSCALAQEAALNVLDYRNEQPVRAKHGMVVSVHHLASEAGVEIMQEGGNAIDAAVATGFALAVVHPAAGNLGGGGFMLVRGHDGFTTFIDYRERAPLAGSTNMYLDARGNAIPNASTLGYRAIATPGSVAGLVYAEKRYGRLSLTDVMAPAIKLARDGFVLTREEADDLKDPDLARFPDSRRIFQRDGNYYKAGEVFRQPELAFTLLRISINPDDFYHGKMAEDLIADLKKGGAILTEEDLAQYKVKERKPLIGTFHDYTIISAPPPSSGGLVLISALNILESYNLKHLGDRSVESMHLITEAMRRAFMDRTDYMGDPDFNHIPQKEILSKRYAAAWRRGIQGDEATPSARLVRPDGFLPPPPTTAGHVTEHNHTTHYSVVDPDGTAVSVTTTLNDSFGSRVTAGSLGFLLNDEMDDFAIKLGTPNYYGLIQGPANLIAPGKRPLSAMTPTIVLENGKLRYVIGSPGGPRIISTVLNIFLSVTEGGLNIQQAVDAPRFHHQYLPDTLYLEPGFDEKTIAGLKSMGYKINIKDGHWSNGECIEIDAETGDKSGGQDHRSHYGEASGW